MTAALNFGPLTSLWRRLLRRGDRQCETSIGNVESALRDAELLVAFAVQSTRGIKSEKIKALFRSVSIVRGKLSATQVPEADDLANFWIAYDDIAHDMAPLSAHSIRASTAINGTRFPTSLLTPTAYNATLAVLVFFVCLALQGFWVAGKELVERADLIEQQKSELQKKIAANDGIIRRLEDRQTRAKEKLCILVNCNDEAAKLTVQSKDATENLAGVRAELDLTQVDYAEKKQVDFEWSRELCSLNELSRPLEELLRRWHERARLVCDAAYLKFLCPVDNPKIGSIDNTELKEKLEAARRALDTAAERLKSSREVTDPPSIFARIFRLDPAALVLKSKQRDIERLEQELADKDADRFRSIVVEVRIIVANIGAYLTRRSRNQTG